MEYEKAYNDLIARINEAKEKPSLCMKDKHYYNGYVETGIRDALDYITSLQQEQPDFDDVDPKHLVHSHYTKVRETKTGRVFWAEYSSEAAEWYEAGTGKAYSISKVEIVKEQPKVELEEVAEKIVLKLHPIMADCNSMGLGMYGMIELVIAGYELGLNARKEE